MIGPAVICKYLYFLVNDKHVYNFKLKSAVCLECWWRDQEWVDLYRNDLVCLYDMRSGNFAFHFCNSLNCHCSNYRRNSTL